jgi:hypothetical protein
VLYPIHFDVLRSVVAFNAVFTRDAYCQRVLEKQFLSVCLSPKETQKGIRRTVTVSNVKAV